MTTNIERVARILIGEGMFDAEAHCYAQALEDAGLLMPDLPAPALVLDLAGSTRAHAKLRAGIEALLESYTIARDAEVRKHQFSTVPYVPVIDQIHGQLTRILEDNQ